MEKRGLGTDTPTFGAQKRRLRRRWEPLLTWRVRYGHGWGRWRRRRLFIKSHMVLLDFKNNVIWERLGYCSQLFTSSSNGIKHSHSWLVSVVFPAGRPDLGFALTNGMWPEGKACLEGVESLRVILCFAFTLQCLPFVMITCAMGWVVRCPPPTPPNPFPRHS